ncbi:MAG: glycosyltransferase family 1 protein [Campylobacterota bacterium]|nr:glycosyltransferase family 1 protein [Campylobacterota bacterium]
MIFHIPMQIDINLHSGSQIRPQKMIQAFKDIGYDVDIVMGYVKQRKKQIQQIKQNIKDGMKYDFLYSESSTMPTALTEKHHLPVAPFLDFNFFKFCRENDIKVGLFYRDIYWVFDEYKNNMLFLKYRLAKYFYKFDLGQYKKCVDIFYLPSKQMYDYVPFDFTNEIIALPPAVEEKESYKISKKNNTLSFIYVGGISDLYDLTIFSKVINSFENIHFNLCTRKKEWEINNHKYNNYLENMQIHHKNGDALSEVYIKSDVSIYFVKTNELWSFAMGVKLFEYISYKKPIIAVKGTAVGEFVKENNIGWVIDYDESQLNKLIIDIQNNPSQIDEKIKNIEKIIPQNTWKARALQVQKDLTK